MNGIRKASVKAMEKFWPGAHMGGPDQKIEANKGFRYPCTQEQIDDLQDRLSLPRHRDELVNVGTAVEELKDSLQGYRGYDHITDAALMRLRGLEDDFKSMIVYPDMVFKIFHDLDLILFNKTLAGNVYLRAKCLEPGLYGDCNTRGKYSKRVCIQINPHNHGFKTDEMGRIPPGMPRCTYKDLIITLIHEMVHAFLFVTCGNMEEWKAEKDYRDYQKKNPHIVPPSHGGNEDGAHGISFQMVLDVVQRRLNKMGRPWNEVDVTQQGHYLPYLARCMV